MSKSIHFLLRDYVELQIFMFAGIELLSVGCRYHYNVADARLRQHVDKGNEEGLYISSGASAANLWALIMDNGNGFSSQVHDLSIVFLHKVII